MKKTKKLATLKPFQMEEHSIMGIRGGRYWDTNPVVNGYTWQDHTCPNGNMLTKADSFRPV